MSDDNNDTRNPPGPTGTCGLSRTPPLVFPVVGPPRAARTGRKRKPTETRMLEGNRGRRAPDPLEPKPEPVRSPSDIPDAPAHLDELAARIWAEEFGPLLVEMKVMTQADWTALGMLCAHEAERRILEDDIAEGGRFYWTTTTAGDRVEKTRPQVGELRRVSASVVVLLREFGLTPASRGKVQTVPGMGNGLGAVESGGGEDGGKDSKGEGYFG